jgi:hypothetical protein
MSEVSLSILDANRAIHGTIHGSDADRAIAALAAEPESIEELDLALRRFTGRDDSHFACFREGDTDEPWDAGIVIIDLAARLIAGESTYSAITSEGSVDDPTRRELVNYLLSDDWRIIHGVEGWRGFAELRRAERANQPRVDARKVLFGRSMLEFIEAMTREYRDTAAKEAVAAVHRDWLTTCRGDLGGKSPRQALLEKKHFINMDLQYRQFQWSSVGECPPGLDRNTAAYQFAGFGTHEIVVYYDLMRFLLWECRARLEQDGNFERSDELQRLEHLCDAWLDSPDPEFHGRTPASIIDNERCRIPEGVTGAEAAVDPDCPCCQMMMEDTGPYFWCLDGCNMDDEFAFSFHLTLEQWEEEQREYEEFNRKFNAEQAKRQLDRDTASRIWKRTFNNEEFADEMPLSQLVPIALFGFAAMVGELNQDLVELADKPETAAAQQDTLNRFLGNLRAALNESAELIDPTLDRLVSELEDLAQQYPQIAEKCSDLSRRLQEFPGKMAASAEWDDIPY